MCYRVVPTPLRAFIESNAAAVKDTTAALHSSHSLIVAETNSDSIYENLAAEEALIRGLTLEKDQCMLLYYINRPCVVVGRNQNIFQEVSLRRAARDGVDVARRASGGGAVFHDRHNLCFSFLTHRSRYAPEKTIQLVRLGLSAAYGIDPTRITTTGRYDLFLDGRKITGSAMRVQRDIAYHHCTLLVDTPHDLLGRYLHPEGTYVDFRTSSVGSVRSPVTTLTESGCVPPAPDAMDIMKANMTDFFFAQGRAVLEAAAPWDFDMTAVRREFAAARSRFTAAPLYQLEVREAVAADMPFVEGEGRRYARGDAVTLREAVEKATSTAWAYAMPTFTSVVEVTAHEFQQRLCSLTAWHDVVQLSALSAPELLEELTETVFALEGHADPAASTGTATASAVRLHTTVDHRNITQFTLAHVTYGSTAQVSETPLEWLTRFFGALLVGNACDAAVAGVEAAGDASVLAQGFVHEAGTATPDLPDLARDASVLMVTKTLLSLWREKNVFDVHVGVKSSG